MDEISLAMTIDDMIAGDPIADGLLTGFYRYLCGYGDALLFDPLIHRQVNHLMVKLFQRLIYELRKLGTMIIFADFNRIVIDTKKESYEAAKEYIDFILLAIQNTESFAYLEVR